MKIKYVILVVLGLIVITGCSNNDTLSGSAVSEVDEAESKGKIKEFDVTARKWEFDPNLIRVKQGDVVRLRVTSQDITHGFAMPQFGVNRELLPGRTEVIEFTATQKGEFPFFCSVYCGTGHETQRGVLIIG